MCASMGVFVRVCDKGVFVHVSDLGCICARMCDMGGGGRSALSLLGSTPDLTHLNLLSVQKMYAPRFERNEQTNKNWG